MKRSLFLIVFVILCISVYSQRIESFNVTTKPDGTIVEKLDNIEITGEVLKGVKEGTWVESHVNTELPHYIIQYVNGKKEGLYMEIDKQATLLKKIDYKNNVMDGIYYQWYKGGRLAKMCHYKNGMLDGTSVICYDRGPIQEESNYKEGKRDGVTIWYYYVEKGQGEKAAMYNYKNGMFEGVQETYYEDGKLKSSKMFSKNVQNGPSIEYYEDGSIKSESTFKNGSQSKIKEYPLGKKRPE